MIVFTTLFICFTIYSFTGWVCETIFCSFLVKKFVNRGFLNGPFCPIYGFGAVILQLALGKLAENILNIFIVFFLGTIITTTLEYFTAWLLETMFHAKWWDYSESKFNIKGRVCLLNSCLFGLMSVALIFVILPFVSGLVEKIPDSIKIIISVILAVYFAADIFLTIKSMRLLNIRLEKISAAFTSIKEKLGLTEDYESLTISQRVEKFREYLTDGKEKRFSSGGDSITEKIKSLIYENKFLQNRILKAFPQIKSTEYPEFLTIIKEKVLHRKK